MDEAKLLEKLKRIDALFVGATTDGERDAAANARTRIQQRLDAVQRETLQEFKFSLNNDFSRALFIAVLRRYNLRPYRLYRQRHTTVMVKVQPEFVDKTLWPQFVELDRTLHGYLHEVTHRVIKNAVHADSSEAEVVEEPKALVGR
jgi:tRNA nucleotidyltransferase (CCA-adding enzyme)